jgi:transcription elongation factor Elf1
MDKDKVIENIINNHTSNPKTHMPCPECGKELNVSFEPEDNDIYIWCDNCDYQKES